MGAGISGRKGTLVRANAAVLCYPRVGMHTKERRMSRRAVACVLLTGLVGLSAVLRAMATENAGGHYAVYLRVVATVLTVEPRGMATIRTADGTTSEVVKGTTWRVGDTMTCEHTARGRTSWQALECRKTS